MSYAGFCEVCGVPYYEADAIRHQHGEAEQANAEINKKFAPQIKALRKEIERAEAAAQKVEQPAVEPQIVDPVEFYEQSVASEAGSTRPEMPPAIWDELKDEIEGEQSMRFDDVPQGSTLAVNKYICDIAKRASAWLRERLSKLNGAASVQQETLNCHRCFEVSNQVLEHVNVLENANDSEEYYSAAFELRKILPSLDQFVKLEIEDALKAAAPRTQGRELQFIGDVRRKYFMPYACSWNGFIREVTAELAQNGGGVYEESVIARINQRGATLLSALEMAKELGAQARTQPVPRTPTCPPRVREYIKAHKLGYGVIGELCQWASAFFTALPEATKEGNMNSIEMIAAERKRQVEREGYTSQHDDEHSNGELAMAAIAYASPLEIDPHTNEMAAIVVMNQGGEIDPVYPFGNNPQSLFCGVRKNLPTETRVKQLATAGALIVAEMERLQRVPAPGRQGEEQ